MREMILTGFKERQSMIEEDGVCDEVLQHTRFCQKKCQSFHGRQGILEAMRRYILGNSESLLVVHGPSGSGKTSIMAMVAQHTKTWLRGKGVVVLRFIGTTPGSTGIVSLLTSVIEQIQMTENETPNTQTDLKDLIDQFHKILTKASVHNPFVILLDSLDQLDHSHDARQLGWLPKHLPPFVKIVVSTLPAPQYECLPRLQAFLEDSHVLAVSTLPVADACSILNSWLTLDDRTLTNSQKEIVILAFKKCPIPLFLKLSFDEACRWKSYDPPKATVLLSTVRTSINALFERVEKLHGQVFVSRALGYLTLAKNGLTESELEDILSCDDEVLNDVYQYWTPPVRRLPPLLIVRMKADLGQYLVDRGADGARVFYWYHRQFTEAARHRYCADPEAAKATNVALADFFGGRWFGKPKAYTDENGEEGYRDRFVAAQPLQFASVYNLRKLNNLLYHLVQGSQLDTLKKAVCLNLEFLLARLKASSLRVILDDFDFARQHFPDDRDIKLVQEALQLSQDALMYDPNQLPYQLLGRMPVDKESILSGPHTLDIQYLMPDKKILTPAGGQLIHCLAGHTQLVNCVDISSDGKFASSAADDDSVRVWNVRAGKIQLIIEDVLKDPERIQICGNDRMVVVGSERQVMGLELHTGHVLYRIEKDSPMNFVICGANRNTLVVSSDKTLFIHRATTGKKITEIVNNTGMEGDFGIDDPISAQGMIMATANQGSAVLRVADIEKRAFVHNKRVFPKPQTEGGDGLSVDALAITPNKELIVFANSTDNDVHVCNLQTLSSLRVIKGRKSDTVEQFHISPDGSTLYFPNDMVMSCVDLKTGKRYNQLKHPYEVFDFVTVDMNTVVSVAADSVVRIWDLTRDNPHVAEKGSDPPRSPYRPNNTLEASKETAPIAGGGRRGQKFKFRMLKPLPNLRYTMAYSSLGEVQIYDLVTKRPVRKGQIPVKGNIRFTVVDTKTVVVTTKDRKMKLVDLDKMVVFQTFQGVIPKYKTEVVVRRNAKEIITMSRGCKNIKIYSMETGSTTAVLKVEQSPKMDEMVLSQDERWLAVSTKGVSRWEGGNLLLFDVSKRTCHLKLTTNDIGGHCTPVDSMFTPCGTYLLLNTTRAYPGFGTNDVEWYFLVIDTETGRIVHHLLDVEYFERNKLSSSDQKVSVGSSTHAYLRDSLFLVGSCDCFIRVWNILSGELLHRLVGHTIDVSELMASLDGTRFVSYSSYNEEGAFRLWDGYSFECLATFKGDREMTGLYLASDGSRMVAGDEPSRELVTWRLEGREVSDSEPLGQVEFEGEQTTLTLNLGVDDDKEFGDDDPDSDEDGIFLEQGPDGDDDEETDEENDDDGNDGFVEFHDQPFNTATSDEGDDDANDDDYDDDAEDDDDDLDELIRMNRKTSN